MYFTKRYNIQIKDLDNKECDKTEEKYCVEPVLTKGIR